jgi:WD40 repeat protein
LLSPFLWSRLGTHLPPDKFRRDDGSTYQSGTEWEIEDAVRSYRERGTPDLFVYRKTSDPQVSLSREDEIAERLRQKKALDAFIDHWFGNPRDSFKAAFTTFETPDQLEEKLEIHLRAVIRERLPDYSGGEPPRAGWHRGSPFRRLEVFEFEHAPIFFGRTQAIGGVCEALKRQAALGRAFVLVLGISGCGKSSLARAGVLPFLTQPGVVEGVDLWRRCIFRPSDSETDPLEALAHALRSADALPEIESLNFSARVLAEHLRRAPQGADGLVRMALAHAADSKQVRDSLSRQPEARLVIVVDQLEEIFTRPNLCDLDRQNFVAALGALARSGVAWVIATMRIDFYPQCVGLSELIALKKGLGQFDLLPPSFDEIGRMIRQPASAAGLAFDEDTETGRRLDEALHESAFKNPYALPLLEFTLDELYRLRAGGRQLTWSAYRELGGLEGAIAHYATTVFQSLDQSVQLELPALLRALVTVGTAEGKPVVAHRTPREVVATTEKRRVLLNALISARLLVADSSPEGTPTVRLTHEALLEHWEPLSAWVNANREELNARARVADALARWLDGGRTSDLLLPQGVPLDEALGLLDAWGGELLEPERDFIVRSAKRANRNRRLKRVVIATLGILTLVAFVLARVTILARNSADSAARLAKESAKDALHQARLANSRRLAVLSESARTQHLDRSLLLAVEAFRTENTIEARNSLLNALVYRPEITTFLHAPSSLAWTAALSPDGKTLAAESDRGVNLCDAQRLQSLTDTQLTLAKGRLIKLAFSPDGTILAALGEGGVVTWDMRKHVRLSESAFNADEGRPTSMRFSPNSKTLAVISGGPRSGAAILWDVASLERLPCRALQVDEGEVNGAAFSADGETLATPYNSERGGGVVLWDMSRRERRFDKPLIVAEGWVTSVAFHPDGKNLATGYVHFDRESDVNRTGRDASDGIILWNLARGERVSDTKLSAVGRPVSSICFSPDGKTLAIGYGMFLLSDGGGVVLSDVARPESTANKPVLEFESHVTSVAIAADQKMLVMHDGGGVLCDLERSERFAEKLLPIKGVAWGVAFSPDGKTLAAGCDDVVGAKVVIRELARSTDEFLSVGEGVVRSVAFSPDGKALAAGYIAKGGGNGGVMLWDATRRARLFDQPLIVAEGGVRSVVFSPDGKTLAASYHVEQSVKGGVILWDTAGRRRLVERPLGVTTSGSASVAFSPDGKTLATGYTTEQSPPHGGIMLWNFERLEACAEKSLMEFEEDVREVAFSPDGNFLAVLCVDRVAIWDVTRRVWATDRFLALAPGRPSSFAFSRNSKILAAGYEHDILGGLSDELVLWQPAQGERIFDKPFLTPRGAVRSVAIDPSGAILAIGNETGVQVCRIDLGSWIDQAAKIANRNLTRDEWRQYFAGAPYRATFPHLPVPAP